MIRPQPDLARQTHKRLTNRHARQSRGKYSADRAQGHHRGTPYANLSFEGCVILGHTSPIRLPSLGGRHTIIGSVGLNRPVPNRREPIVRPWVTGILLVVFPSQGERHET